MRNRIFKQSILGLSLGLALSSCNSTPDEPIRSSAPVTEERENLPDEQSALGPLDVEIKAMKFQPAEIFVKVGDTITFINNDLVDHDITEQKSKEWSSSTLSPGKSWSMVVTKSAAYFCSIHQVMKGKITVQ